MKNHINRLSPVSIYIFPILFHATETPSSHFYFQSLFPVWKRGGHNVVTGYSTRKTPFVQLYIYIVYICIRLYPYR